MSIHVNIFNSIAHDELQLGYVIHTELYNNIIEKYQKMGDIPEQGEKIAVIYSGYSWITLEYLLKAVFVMSEILFLLFDTSVTCFISKTYLTLSIIIAYNSWICTEVMICHS